MAVNLDLADIQGNILSAYGKLGFPKGRFITLNVRDPAGGRKFVDALLPEITTALRWRSERSMKAAGRDPVPRPDVAVNIAFSFYGLLALDLPIRTLRGMPDEFIDGMRARAPMLGDDFGAGTDAWDPVWRAAEGARLADPNTVHILVTLNARMNPDGTAVPALDAKTRSVEALCESIGGVRILPGHNLRNSSVARQVSGAVRDHVSQAGRDRWPDAERALRLHGRARRSGLRGDGSHESEIEGNGAVDGAGKWRALATGEFLLGYPDEAQEIAGAAMPLDFSRNGTFMAYRKLHQNVAAFDTFMTDARRRVRRRFRHRRSVGRARDPQGEDRRPLVRRRSARARADGRRVARVQSSNIRMSLPRPTLPDTRPAAAPSSDFTYGDDTQGLRCPVTSHMRRVNTRDGMAPTGKEGSVLNNRRRILRRGLPYGDASNGGARHSRARHRHAGRVREPVPAVRVRAAAMDQLRPRRQCRQRYRPAGRQPFAGDGHLPEGQVRHPLRSENGAPAVHHRRAFRNSSKRAAANISSCRA